jgi:hypothetical protein
LRSRKRLLGYMASPDVFRSPHSRSARRAGQLANSSSPDLPSLGDLLSNGLDRPPFRSPTRQTSLSSQRNASYEKGATGGEIQDTADVSIIELASTPTSSSGKVETSMEETVLRSKFFTDSQPWRKFKSPTHSKPESGDKPLARRDSSPTPAGTVILGGQTIISEVNQDRSSDGEKDSTTVSKAKKQISNEPLNLESASNRRLDWTPPSRDKVPFVDLGSDPSALIEANPSTQRDGNGFKNLLESYVCDVPQTETITISDEDSSFLKKRKLIELVRTTEKSVSPPPSPEKPQAKKKASKKKKPRTITDLATAAYQPQEPASTAMPAQSQLNFPRADTVVEEKVAESATEKGKGKGKGRAKAVKPSKKITKAQQKRVEHVLLSPAAALKQSAGQDFVFGTSSQLVREQSPTLLRDLQTAMKHSNLLEMIDMDETAHSDSDFAQSKPSMWDAAARDDDGGLLDIEIVDLVDKSPRPTLAGPDEDPFGYFNEDETSNLRLPEPSIPKVYDESFETLSDILPPPKKAMPRHEDGDSLCSFSDVSVSTDVRASTTLGTNPTPTTQSAEELTGTDSTSLTESASNEPARPSFELYTDVQLSKEIASYGFKPLKSRAAKISRLDQCWRSKHSALHSGARTITTSSAAARRRNDAPAAPVAQESTPKKSRGRPRKTPSSPVEVQEPPPSAQPVESPKRPRGRPKKDRKVEESTGEAAAEAKAAANVSPTKGRGRSKKKTAPGAEASASSTTGGKSQNAKTTKTATKPKPTTTVNSRPTTPVRKTPKFQTVLEIPDSASDHGSDGSFLSSSPEQTFSSPTGVDLSVSLGEDTELLFSASPSGQQALVFERISEAVTTAPSSKDPNAPSWYEKMLIYDPIILEDFTAWLNSGQLSKVGLDDEVSPGEVKKWCESKSVCCLWRNNLHGKGRKRY